MAIIIFLKNWRDTGLFISVLQLQGNIINSNLAYLERGGDFRLETSCNPNLSRGTGHSMRQLVEK